MKKFVVLLLALVVLSLGCKGANYPAPDSRANARNVVMTITLATKMAVNVCVTAMETMEDAGDEAGAQELGEKCRDILVPVMIGVRAAAKAVDNWEADEGALGKVACLAKTFVGAVKDWADLIKTKGEVVPAIIVDALPIVSTAVGFAPASCH